MKQLLTSFILSLTFFTVFAQMPSYYWGIDFNQPATTVEANLKTLITNTHNPLTYSNTYNWIKLADEDASNTSNVILMYNGQSISKGQTIGGGNTTQPEVWNREHVYPQSMINSPADADLHHLRACDGVINGNRGNSPFVTGTGNYGSATGGWYPGDDWKGDVARMIMYVHLRYNEPWTDVGSLALFLQWNVEDPVSAFEKQRNNIIQGAQGNRNPFIDQPYLATYFWGGTPAEDTWGWPNLLVENQLDGLLLFPNPVAGNGVVTLDHAKDLSQVNMYDMTGRLVQSWNSFTVSNDLCRLNLDHIQAGTYTLTVRSSKNAVTKKVVVE